MTDVEFSERARAQLAEIYLFGYQQFGERQADRYIDKLEDTFRLLADNPRMGRRAEAIAPGIRRHEHARHVILYEEVASGVTILAVVHGSAMRRLRL